MKKAVSVVLALFICVGIVSGCGKNEKNDNGGKVKFTSEYYDSFDYGNRLDSDGCFTGISALDFVTLGTYKGMEIPESVTDITSGAVQSEINTMLKKYAEDEHITDRAAKTGDVVNITYVATIDGEPFDGGSSGDEGVDIEIGKDNLLENFTEQCNGHFPGDSFEVYITYPDDYEEAKEGEFTVNGKDAVFAVTLNYIIGEKNVLPKLTDNFVTEHFAQQYKWNTVEGMKNGIRKILLNQNLSSYIQSKLLSECKISKLPDSVYIYQAESMLAYYYKAATQNEMTFDTYIGKSMETFVDENDEKIKAQAKISLILQAIYEENPDLTVTEDDIKAFYAKFFPDEDYENAINNFGVAYLSMVTMNEKVLNYIRENADYKGPKPSDN